MSINALKNSLDEFIKKDDLTIVELKEVLTPISKFVDAPVFVQNIDSIINIIITDRNGDKKFNVADLQLLGRDAMAIASLVSAILLIILSIPDLKFKYDQGATEELVFKLLAYIFLLLIPNQVGKKLSLDEKTFIVNLTLIIYQSIQTSRITQDLIAKLQEQLKTKKGCNCFSGPQEDPLQKNLPLAKLHLTNNMNNIRDKSETNAQIKSLQNQLNKKQSSEKKVRTQKKSKKL